MQALDDHGMTDVRSQVAVVATVVTEVGPDLRPIHEHGSRTHFTQMYEGRPDLGNTRPGDGARWREVRLKVNGGLNGWTSHRNLVTDLLRASGHQYATMAPSQAAALDGVAAGMNGLEHIERKDEHERQPHRRTPGHRNDGRRNGPKHRCCGPAAARVEPDPTEG